MQIRIFLGLVAICTASSSWGYIVDGSRVNQPRLLSYATSKMQNHGTLEQSKHGFTYLRVSDQYVAELLHQVKMPGFQLPSYDTLEADNSAHISIIDPSEAQKIKKLAELGQTIQFKPLGFYTIVLHDKEYFMLAVEAPELSLMRKKYGLSETLASPFNIIIGVRQLTAENELVDPKTLQR